MGGRRACHDASIVIPPATIELAAKWWRDSQTRSASMKGAPLASAAEGWCYRRREPEAHASRDARCGWGHGGQRPQPSGAMTAGGVGSLVICDYILNVDWKKDVHVLAGMEWLAKNFSVAYNPGPYEHA